MKKQRYVKPSVEVIPCALTLLDSLSMQVSYSGASGGGDSKKATIIDEPEDDQWGYNEYKVWE